MATRKYVSLERLQEYDVLIKQEIAKSTVKESEHAGSADTATSATTATTAKDAEKLGGQLPSYYAKASDIPNGALASKDTVSESDLDSALAEKVNAASEGNHAHLNKDVLDGITAGKVSAWDSAEANAKAYADGVKNDLLNGAGAAYDTLKELGDLINENTSTLDALEQVATGKADKEHVHSWEELSDKPFGETSGIEITWDGNTEGLEYAKHKESESNTTGIYRVSDIVLTNDELKKATLGHCMGDINNPTVGDIEMTEEEWNHRVAAGAITEEVADFDLVWVVRKDNYTHVLVVSGEEVVFPKAGVYFYGQFANDAVNYFTKLSVPGGSIKQLDEKYIPDTIARISDLESKADKEHEHGWNELNDKPFGETSGIEITWDGVTDGLEFVDAGDAIQGGAGYYLLSETSIPYDVLQNGSMILVTDGSTIPLNISDMWNYMVDGGLITEDIAFLESVVVVNKENAQYTADGGAIVVTFPKVGVYFIRQSSESYTASLTCSGSIKQLDEKYIPDTIARISDLESVTIPVDSELSTTSENPVQNKVINTALNNCIGAISANTSSITAHNTAIENLQAEMGEWEEITSAEIQAMFA